MGLITEEVEIGLSGNNVKYLESLGYEIPRRKDNKGEISYIKGQMIKIKVNDLKDKSNIKVDIQCDNTNCKKILKNIRWENYKDNILKHGVYYCRTCAINLHGISISFKQWCIENNRQDLIDRWDYELNCLKPDEILYATSKKYYFKCPKGLHKSELKSISSITSNRLIKVNCKICNSFAQHGIDTLDKDFLEKYWDYNINVVDPWSIPSQYNKKVWIKCQEKDYHGSYEITCNSFIGNYSRCPYCAGKKVHPLDSLGTIFFKVLSIWSDKNTKTSYEYMPMSKEHVWWKCPDGKHEDYERRIGDSNRCDFRCPECDYSHGENNISEVLMFYKVYYIPQKEFDGLVGLGNGLLSYDFYIPKYNLLIEYQGEQHEKYIPGFHKSKKDFEKQLEHDKRKREYAKEKNIELLEIWYWDFDNIEEILEKELNLLSII